MVAFPCTVYLNVCQVVSTFFNVIPSLSLGLQIISEDTVLCTYLLLASTCGQACVSLHLSPRSSCQHDPIVDLYCCLPRLQQPERVCFLRGAVCECKPEGTSGYTAMAE